MEIPPFPRVSYNKQWFSQQLTFGNLTMLGHITHMNGVSIPDSNAARIEEARQELAQEQVNAVHCAPLRVFCRFGCKPNEIMLGTSMCYNGKIGEQLLSCKQAQPIAGSFSYSAVFCHSDRG